MGLGIDTVVATATNPGAAPAADNAAVNAGDSKAVRNFNLATAKARLDYVSRQGVTTGFVGIKSPRFHDVSRGFQIITTDTPAVQLMPPQTGQPVYGADTLQLTLSGGGAEVDAMCFGIYYTDIPGIAALLKSPADILPMIQNVKPIEVDVSAQATSGGWSDTALTTTENLLKANTWYAVLGYTVDTASLAVGLKGPETGNLRLCGPGPTTTFFTDQYFVYMSERHQAPYIPIFNSNNRANLFVSTALVSTAATPKVQLITGELAAGFAP